MTSHTLLNISVPVSIMVTTQVAVPRSIIRVLARVGRVRACWLGGSLGAEGDSTHGETWQ
jgi:hypothetical protein